MMGDEQTPTPQRGQWRSCFCGQLAQIEGVCQAHYDLRELVQCGLFSDWQGTHFMQHNERMTDPGLSLLPGVRYAWPRDGEIAEEITAMRLAYFGDWREHEGKAA